MTQILPESGYWRRFCHVAAAVFAAVVLYTFMVKVPSGRFGGDWLHTVLHVVTGGVALVLAGSPRNARLFAGSLFVIYGTLGVLGWSTDGVLMNTVFRIPLAAADNMFHLSLAMLSLVALLGDAARRRAAQLDAAQRRPRASH